MAPPAAGAPLLQLDDVTVVRGDRTLLDHVSLGVAAGDRIGVVGRNGAGKSTLLDTLTGVGHIDSGRVVVSAGVRVAVVAQHDRLPSGSVQEAIVGDSQHHEWAADAGIRDVVGGLFGSLDAPLLAQATDNLSGGESRRVALARALVADWEVLVLDEPTNHLDLKAIRWLADHVQALPKRRALVVVTHDRWFLDEVTSLTWEVHDGVVDAYDGGYAAYVLAKTERERQAAVIGARRANVLRKELAWLRRGPPARTSKPKFRIDAANALIEDEPPVRDAMRLRTVAAARLGKKVLDLSDVTLRPAMGVPPIATELTWGLGPGDRVGILGPNGAGKTTLMRLVLDQQGPGAPLVDSGRVDRGSTVRPGALEQRLADVDTDARVLPWLRDVGEQVTVTTGEELTPSQLLEQFGFSDDTAWKRLGDLSGGELRRLFLLRLLLRGPNLVVLDEPTNDLDIDTLTVLEDVLDSWPGTLVVVSHDRYFLERVCDDIYLMADGALRHLPGGVDEYLAVLAGGGSGSTGGRAGADGGGAAASTSVADEGLSSTQERAIRKEIGGIERRVEKLEQQVVRLHDRMATHDQSDYSGLADLTAQLREVEAEVATLEERWFELSELLG